jgi:hypothetical protein
MALAALADRVLLWLHGRRLGLVGDGQSSNSSVLALDGVAVGSTRGGTAAIPLLATSLSAAGAVTLTGAVVGDTVQKVYDQNSAVWTDVTSSFEASISVANQIQQSASTSSHGVIVFLQPNS